MPPDGNIDTKVQGPASKMWPIMNSNWHRQLDQQERQILKQLDSTSQSFIDLDTQIKERQQINLQAKATLFQDILSVYCLFS